MKQRHPKTDNAELRSITVKAYRDEGNPTCGLNFETGEVCVFYRTQRFGCHETCIFGETDSKWMEALKRRGKGTGSLIPLSRCPIWPFGQDKTMAVAL